ncbi:MAG TPA: PIG-L family deacetylase [Bryobacteraceae bacterium]|nr:PIG-L family deacetylase [Bryobacteraceae bacterium]
MFPQARRLSVLFALASLAGAVWISAISRAQDTYAPLGHTPDDTLRIAENRGAPGLSAVLRSLRTRASVLHIVAHPDDEDGGMLAYETRGQGARAALFTLNRGEGGQNAMSADLYDALGLVRTEELLAAGRYYGVDQYWSSAVDFGFSKTREESLEKWGHDRVLADAVRAVRMTRPLVLTSVFVGAATDGHGQHQVAGQINQEAYLYAGDPTKFPDQIREGLRPWTPLKVYARVPIFQATSKGMYDYAIDKYVPVRFFDYVQQKWSTTTPSTTVTIPEGGYSSANGLTYTQISRTGWGLQKSQNGGGTTPPPSPISAAYHRYGSRVSSPERESGFFDGIDTTLEGIATLAKGDTQFVKDGLAGIQKQADTAWNQFSADRTNGIAPALVDGLKETRALMSAVRGSSLAEPGKSDVLFELGVKEKQFQTALTMALGISFQATVAPPGNDSSGPFPAARGTVPTFTIAIPGQSFAVETAILNQSPETISLDGMDVKPSGGKDWKIAKRGDVAKTLTGGKGAVTRFTATVPGDASFTRPYFTRPNEEQPYYDLLNPSYRDLSFAPYPLIAHARLTYRGVPFELEQTVQTAESVHGIGIVNHPLIVAPAISVTVSPSAGAVPLGSKSFDFACTVHSNVKGPAQGILRLKLPAGWRSAPPEASFSFARDGDEQTFRFSVIPGSLRPADYTITAEAEYTGKKYAEGYRLTGYAGLRPYPDYRAATYKAVGVNVKTAPNLEIGFLPGTGDDVPRAMENLGTNVQILSGDDLGQGDLSRYSAIVLGVRAYAVRPDLRTANGRLLDYVKYGGVLIVQYNLQNFDRNYGPYPFVLGSNPQKVVDESSPVKLLEPSSPALNWPNKITEADFNGWVEERGHGFLKSWSSQYQPLLETHDPGQDPQKGGMLLARYGKGFYVYDAFALYRQLPSGVPGAFRLLANLISLGKNPLK